MWNANRLVRDKNSGGYVHFLWWKPLYHRLFNFGTLSVCVCVCVWDSISVSIISLWDCWNIDLNKIHIKIIYEIYRNQPSFFFIPLFFPYFFILLPYINVHTCCHIKSGQQIGTFHFLYSSGSICEYLFLPRFFPKQT